MDRFNLFREKALVELSVVYMLSILILRLKVIYPLVMKINLY